VVGISKHCGEIPTLIMEKILIQLIAIFISVTHANVMRCNLRDGSLGYCVAPSACASVQSSNFIFYPDSFCFGDYTMICCDELSSINSRHLRTTTEATDEPSNQSFEDHPNFKLFDFENCGVINTGRKISRGQIAGVLEFPWAALIGYDIEGEIMFLCGGSLISSEVVKYFFKKIEKDFIR
jgi:hypothetical protein